MIEPSGKSPSGRVFLTILDERLGARGQHAVSMDQAGGLSLGGTRNPMVVHWPARHRTAEGLTGAR
jgi:arylsulfatase A-like enzyme